MAANAAKGKKNSLRSQRASIWFNLLCHLSVQLSQLKTRWMRNTARSFSGAQYRGGIPCSHLQNSETLKNMRSKLSPSNGVQNYICHLTDNSLFPDIPTRTNVFLHGIDGGDHPPITRHANRVNPTKCGLFQKEVAYLLENGLAVPSLSSGVFPAFWCRSQIKLCDFAPISEK